MAFDSSFLVAGNVTIQKDAHIVGDISLDSNLCVGGDVSLNQKLYVVDDVAFDSSLLVSGNVTIQNDTHILGDISLDNNLYVGDTIYGKNVLIIDPSPFDNSLGTVRIRGNLHVDGSQTIIHSETLEIKDKTIVLAKNSVNNENHESGIIIDNSGGEFLYKNKTGFFTSWHSNVGISVSGGKAC